MEWFNFADKLPLFRRKVILFRYKERRYTIAWLIEEMRNNERKVFWRSSWGNSLKTNEQDWWCEFEPLTITDVFD